MRINAKVIENDFEIKNLFNRAKSYYLANIERLNYENREKRKTLAKRIIKLKQQLYKRERKNAEKEILNSFSEIIEKANKQYKSSVNKAKNNCIDIIYDICTEIIGNEISISKVKIQEKLFNEISKLNCNKIGIEVSPLEITSIKKNFNNQENIYFIENSKLNLGNTNLITNSGRIEITWEKHLFQLIEQLKNSNLNA